MNEKELTNYIHNGLSTREIASKTNKSQTNIRFWLKKFNLKTKPKFEYQNNEKLCKTCNTIKPMSEFYKKRDKEYPNKYPISYCIVCSKQQAVSRQRNLKKQAIIYKGGCCQHCGYSKCQAALEFHHLDPCEKDFTIANNKCTSFDKIKCELDKCILLCSNCHKEEHFKNNFLTNKVAPAGLAPA